MGHRQLDRRELLRPQRAALEGQPVAYSEVVRAGRMIAAALMNHARSLSITGEGPGPGLEPGTTDLVRERHSVLVVAWSCQPMQLRLLD
jgi:hypothetical protein